ncbi:MAG: YggT family protein [Candidatus Omnitrophica bacterium]|nr:YggT family protein [Candidatus Omnitrophota bacterium]
MFVLANALEAIAVIADKVLWIYSLILLIAILLTWVNPDPFNPIVQFLRAATEPVLDWIRRHLPFVVIGMLDLSPIVAFLGIQLIQMVVIRTLLDVAIRLR